MRDNYDSDKSKDPPTEHWTFRGRKLGRIVETENMWDSMDIEFRDNGKKGRCYAFFKDAEGKNLFFVGDSVVFELWKNNYTGILRAFACRTLIEKGTDKDPYYEHLPAKLLTKSQVRRVKEWDAKRSTGRSA